MQIGVESSRAVENKRLFVVDSDEITSAALQFMLHDENETHELPTVDAALAKSVDWKPDVILLGIAVLQAHGPGLPGMLRSRIGGVKLLLVTGPENADFAGEARKSGAVDGVLMKPLTIENARKQVDRLLGRRTRIDIPVQVL